ncbi:MAG: hypothetical protein COX81_01855 [Candidatus Magasanikbacteria bacterium CG_4_10_14_0_2_um_filter_37_12]|uniref:Uncharacterized protein n=1 Tax=Candidatus Magasanikbacteria bacterium CG_4_10_14_0_2_um_filter_37_12 TaxID=1974637 RepID=A0A2M7V8B8_9BACT|nr:MAG: hypothetical protein COX81_01855 [Candidatus Magasanikbacteria bacterium CG_4_10_14_0_2_um_filter_37_12]
MSVDGMERSLGDVCDIKMSVDLEHLNLTDLVFSEHRGGRFFKDSRTPKIPFTFAGDTLYLKGEKTYSLVGPRKDKVDISFLVYNNKNEEIINVFFGV